MKSKVFVTGIYGSGKTEFAKQQSKLLGLKYLDFDSLFEYKKVTSGETSEDKVYKAMTDNYIIDAIPFALEGGGSKKFLQYATENDVSIVCCVCSNKEEWTERIRTVKRLVIDEEKYKNYYHFYYRTLPLYCEFDISYYDTYTDEYITKEQLYERIAWSKTCE